MMKKWCALMLILALLTSAFALAEEADTGYDHLTVGNPTPMRGDFFTDLWGNATSDIDVRDLLHGYNLIMWDGANGMFTADPSVVSELTAIDNDQGDRRFVFVLYDDLYYSDGTKITAWDYAFSWLLRVSSAIAELGGQPARPDYLLGYQAYSDGAANTLAGVRVLADDMLMVTLDHAALPFFYEVGLLSCHPYPIGVIAPGYAVRDDGEGVYLADASGAAPLTAELLRSTVMGENGYRAAPSVVSGPYTLTSWDGVTAQFAVNPYYKGNALGQKPAIPTLTYTCAQNADVLDGLKNGAFGLLNKVTRADVINAAFRDGVEMSTYPRSGLSFISFCCERETVASQAVRQAIAWCMDRDRVMADYTGNYGLRVDGYYGMGQWMYGVVNHTIAAPVDPPENEGDAAAQAEYEEKLAAFEALNLDGLTAYTVDTDRAAALLDADGWTLNAEGLRVKHIDGREVTLNLKLIYPEGNTIATSLQENLAANLERVGIRLTMEAQPMAEVLGQYYRQQEREADMILLAANFSELFDPSAYFVAEADGTHTWVNTALNDEALYAAALAMRQTAPGDVLGYMQRWIAFEERFNETLPMLPIYSNVYFDFYTGTLRNYNISESVTWGQAIVGAVLSDKPLEEEADTFEE